jgi:RTX calcium-binding nonapeptide repeat (4 copies)
VRRLLAAAGVIVVVCTIPALTATNAVPGTRASQTASAITGNNLKPSACAAVNIQNVVVGIDGTGVRDLVLGTAAGTSVRGRATADCVLGGGGNDTINGDGGTDVCIGGPGTDTFANCETQIQ